MARSQLDYLSNTSNEDQLFLDLFDDEASENDSEEESKNESRRHDEDALSIEEEDVSSHHCSILLLSNQASPIYTKASQFSEHSEEEDVSSSHCSLLFFLIRL